MAGANINGRDDGVALGCKCDRRVPKAVSLKIVGPGS